MKGRMNLHEKPCISHHSKGHSFRASQEQVRLEQFLWGGTKVKPIPGIFKCHRLLMKGDFFPLPSRSTKIHWKLYRFQKKHGIRRSIDIFQSINYASLSMVPEKFGRRLIWVHRACKYCLTTHEEFDVKSHWNPSLMGEYGSYFCCSL